MLGVVPEIWLGMKRNIGKRAVEKKVAEIRLRLKPALSPSK